MLIKETEPKNQKKVSKNIPDTNANTVEYIQDLYDQKSKNGMNYRRTILELKKVKGQIEELTEKIEENGGINCGWRSKDHTKFMEILFRMKNRIDSTPFIDECSIHLALYSEDALK